MDNPGWYLIAYDIADPLRLQRLHRRLRREGVAMQLSVFLVQRSQSGIVALMDELETLIHHREDDLRAYPVHDPGQIWLRGKGVMDHQLLRSAQAGPDPAKKKQSWWRRLIGG